VPSSNPCDRGDHAVRVDATDGLRLIDYVVHRFRIADHNLPVSGCPEIAAGGGGGIEPTERDFQGVGLWRGADGSMSADGPETNRPRLRKWPSSPRARNSLPKC
jgi:hypothetical protein